MKLAIKIEESASGVAGEARDEDLESRRQESPVKLAMKIGESASGVAGEARDKD